MSEYSILSIIIISVIFNFITTVISILKLSLMIEHRITSLEVQIKGLYDMLKLHIKEDLNNDK